MTHSPVYLVRWCEWIALAGLMTFLCEGVALNKPLNGDGKDSPDLRSAVRNSIAQTVSCLT